jgi:hypothetical protein
MRRADLRTILQEVTKGTKDEADVSLLVTFCSNSDSEFEGLHPDRIRGKKIEEPKFGCGSAECGFLWDENVVDRTANLFSGF